MDHGYFELVYGKGEVHSREASCPQSRQNEYADNNVRDVCFVVGEQVLLKVSSMKSVMRFGKKEKLIPRYSGSFKVLDRVGMVAYRLALPPYWYRFHPVFHVSMLMKYFRDGDFISKWDSVGLDENLSYEEEPEAVLGRDVLKLRSKEIASSGGIVLVRRPFGNPRVICVGGTHIFFLSQVLFFAFVFS